MAEERADLVPAREDAAPPRRVGGRESADHLGRAAKVSDVIEREARETERAGTMTRPVFDALVDSELFWILLPADLGGGGQGVVTFLEVVEELSRADASSGWSYMANAGSIGIAAGFLQAEAVREMFGGPDKAITAGQLGPIGRGTEAGGGFRFTGNYQFGSGSAHASWIGGGFLIEDEGRVRVGADGQPDARVAFLPRELDLAVARLVARLVDSAPLALRAIKENLADVEALDLATYLDRESRRHAAVRASDDARDAAQAFTGTRPPRFNGK